jgi:hypothetical protein
MNSPYLLEREGPGHGIRPRESECPSAPLGARLCVSVSPEPPGLSATHGMAAMGWVA